MGYTPNDIAIFHRDNDHYITRLGFCRGLANIFSNTPESDFQVAITSLRLLGVLGALYAFLFGLDLMGMAFKVDRD